MLSRRKGVRRVSFRSQTECSRLAKAAQQPATTCSSSTRGILSVMREGLCASSAHHLLYLPNSLNIRTAHSCVRSNVFRNIHLNDKALSSALVLIDRFRTGVISALLEIVDRVLPAARASVLRELDLAVGSSPILIGGCQGTGRRTRAGKNLARRLSRYLETSIPALALKILRLCDAG